MPNPSREQFRNGLVRTAQIIKAALVMGVMTFGAIVVFLSLNPQAPAGDPAATPAPLVICYIGAGGAALMIVARVVVPNLIAASHRRQIAAGTWTTPSRHGNTNILPADATHADRLYPVYMIRMIVGDALLEGAAFFNLVAFMVEGQVWNAAIAGVLAFLIAVTFPTRSSVDGWVEQQLALLEMERQDHPA